MTDMRSLMSLVTESPLDEMAGAGPSRINRHIHEGTPFIMLSACRAELSSAVNKRRTQLLKNKLSATSVSFIVTGGEYHEVGQEDPSEETSFFVMPNDPSKLDALRALGLGLARLFEQDSIAYGDGEHIYLIFDDGSDMTIGNAASFDMAKISNAAGFSKVKQRKFTFLDKTAAPNATVYGAAKRVA